MLDIWILSDLSQETITWLAPWLLPDDSTYIKAHPIGGKDAAPLSDVGEVFVVDFRNVIILAI